MTGLPQGHQRAFCSRGSSGLASRNPLRLSGFFVVKPFVFNKKSAHAERIVFLQPAPPGDSGSPFL
jgi:hypothetical protein